MELSGHGVLVTGGATGIGAAIATRFLKAGSDVLICGRRADKLRELQERYPQLRTRVCDLEDPTQRVALRGWAISEFPSLDVLVNNAGIQQRIQLADEPDWDLIHREIAVNFESHVHLVTLFIPHLLRCQQPAIINVSSGLSFVPLARVPIYSATKAAIHSFTLSLRQQLRDTPIDVIEVIPPGVNTDLGGPGLHTWGVALDEFANAVFDEVQKPDVREIAYQFSAESSRASREALDAIFERMNAPG
ncbi:MAG: SDR family NAD(P)-dependent oxidoreductase [Candidatus Eremiobacteraeota bacterium]|nr:SDR family NAD(P)-dependent oxidoreductase [Candidatus Eremiobacteraeota bacterium]MBV8668616.1 SDR family NAD(P)-dependent oxidoreductase [Candidatus Eremiobacteraeota bacterium]